MGDWGFLSSLLDKVLSPSTVLGKVWMNVLFLLRVMVLCQVAWSVFGDKDYGFTCNTQQPGCEEVCYNWVFPVSPIHFCWLQIILVSTPTLIYLGHAMHVVYRENKTRENLSSPGGTLQLKLPQYPVTTVMLTDKVTIKGDLLGSYLTQLFFKVLIEAAFVAGQYLLYGSDMRPRFSCNQYPCPRSVDCFLPRATEKSALMWYMLAVACASALLSLVELLFLCVKAAKERLTKRQD